MKKETILEFIFLFVIILSYYSDKFAGKNQRVDKTVIPNDAKRARLTLDELRQYPGLESIDEKEGYAAIASLESYSRILFELFTEQKRNKNER